MELLIQEEVDMYITIKGGMEYKGDKYTLYSLLDKPPANL